MVVELIIIIVMRIIHPPREVTRIRFGRPPIIIISNISNIHLSITREHLSITREHRVWMAAATITIFLPRRIIIPHPTPSFIVAVVTGVRVVANRHHHIII